MTMNFLNCPLLATIQDDLDIFEDEAESVISAISSTAFWPDWSDMWNLLFRLLISVVTIGIIVHAFYYPKAKRPLPNS